MQIRYTSENFEHHWGFINWKNKLVLDIGADYGSTAECFAIIGSSKIYAVEGDESLYNQLVEYTKDKPNIIPEKKWISTPDDFIDLFTKFKIDIAKIDCEGAEIHLLTIPDNILRSIREYAIECHSQYLLNKIVEKLRNLKFNIIAVRSLAVEITVIYAVRA